MSSSSNSISNSSSDDESRPLVHRTPIPLAEYNYDLDEQCSEAAEALEEADVLILFTGAGFSADSGLAVYGDVARIPAYQKLGLEYRDLCQPHFLENDPEIFYGFWGQCFNDYRSTQPHEGYQIIKKWRDEVNRKQEGRIGRELSTIMQRRIETSKPFDDEDTQRYSVFRTEVYKKPAGAFYCFTSNVDAHSYDVFEAHELFECHGNVEVWQCSQSEFMCTESGLWRVPMDYTFDVDQNTMHAPYKKRKPGTSKEEKKKEEDTDAVPHIGQTKGEARTHPLQNMPPAKNVRGWKCPLYKDGSTANWPRCRHCKNPARPSILMFVDFLYQRDRASRIRWRLWTESLLRLCQIRRNNDDPALKVCILEIGCGLNVPTCRKSAESLVEQIQQVQGEATLVRINPDFPMVREPDVAPYSIPIKLRGLDAIRQIDRARGLPTTTMRAIGSPGVI